MLSRQDTALRHASFTSGYLLMGIVVFLAAYNWRKKLSVIPLGTSAFWLQLHIYAGFSAIVLFLAHIGLRIPDGMFETTLAAVFAIVAASGLYGLYLSRTIPQKLSQVSSEVVYERVPVLRRELAQSATQLAFDSVNATHATTVAEFYAAKLNGFFAQPRGIWYAAFPNSRRRRALMSELSHMERFFSDAEKKVSEKLFGLIRKKDDLDYQFALQHKLRLWLVVHGVFSVALLLLGIVHAITAWRYMA